MKPETLPDASVRPSSAEPLISLRELHVHFAIRKNALARLLGGSSGTVRAVDGVNLDLAPGEVLGLVGESGSGKSTLGRALLGLVRPTGGSITYRGQELVGLRESRLRPLRRKLQMVFQDPHASLNPSMTVGGSIADALRIHGIGSTRGSASQSRAALVADALEKVGLTPAPRFSEKYPSELSGGQKQRAVIARAIALGPELLVADEPISMLDMSVRAKILELLQSLRRELNLTYVYVTHDLASARFFCDRIAIMYLGKIVEIGRTDEIFAAPRHPYTKALLRAVPDPDPSRGVARDLPRGEVPDAANPPAGCSFHPRCPESFRPCGWQGRDLRMVLEQRWTTLDTDSFARESAVVGDLDGAEDASGMLRVQPAHGSAEDELTMLKDERSTRPDEPLWSAVDDLAVRDGRVELRFAEPFEPQLRPVPGSSVSVSCHHYHDPATGEPRPS